MKNEIDSLGDVHLHPNSILKVDNISTSVCVCVYVYVCVYISVCVCVYKATE